MIDDARLALSPSALLPGLGRVAITIEHAEAGATVFKTPLSWLFALGALRAAIELPAGITLELTYDHGELVVAGGLFGAAPIALPVALPVADLADDPRRDHQARPARQGDRRAPGHPQGRGLAELEAGAAVSSGIAAVTQRTGGPGVAG